MGGTRRMSRTSIALPKGVASCTNERSTGCNGIERLVGPQVQHAGGVQRNRQCRAPYDRRDFITADCDILRLPPGVHRRRPMSRRPRCCHKKIRIRPTRIVFRLRASALPPEGMLADGGDMTRAGANDRSQSYDDRTRSVEARSPRVDHPTDLGGGDQGRCRSVETLAGAESGMTPPSPRRSGYAAPCVERLMSSPSICPPRSTLQGFRPATVQSLLTAVPRSERAGPACGGTDADRVTLHRAARRQAWARRPEREWRAEAATGLRNSDEARSDKAFDMKQKINRLNLRVCRAALVSSVRDESR